MPHGGIDLASRSACPQQSGIYDFVGHLNADILPMGRYQLGDRYSGGVHVVFVGNIRAGVAQSAC